ncbi:MAG: DNA double-strand break repair nuclease NurA [candidate division Zixibacteria bacterium]|nr:DNA double-strand break repair nuclease NurA [candidate division Zixibacteria bacterium]NIS14656.1 DNA double-strand break repair nuclease NurA [candidate division Zixibacteria bacterium]NIS45655.1 DNA double-strand break repair nuclease NurA [candidate division Zixibacteria bacterium]NIT51184.1 DNA double-strand break repair nuclease NurA [candidate division Zixibacteria bacterium]NIU13783.1 DNA double-strand break repair nuclease NurA [candidate division Zixibacteria bacterium]
MDSTVDYIARLLTVDPSLRLLEPSEEESDPVELETELDQVEYTVIEDLRHKFSAGAVDGGQGTIIRNNVFQAGVYRAGYVKFRKRGRVEEYSEPLLMVNLTRENYAEIYEQQFFDSHGKYPSQVPAFPDILGALRRLAEEKAIFKCIENLEAGDMLLLDGSLYSDNHGFLNELIEKAASREIDIVSVAKASGLLWRGGANLAAVIKSRGDELHQKKSWYAPVGRVGQDRNKNWIGNIFIAKLNPHSDLAFRIDLSKVSKRKPFEIFAQLSELATDPFFLGYPYPLAAVHQMVRLSEDELYGFMLRLQSIALQKGIEQSRWDLLFADYHRILNFDLRETQFRRL